MALAGFLGLPNQVKVSWTGQFGTSYDAETGRVTADLMRTCGSNGAWRPSEVWISPRLACS